MKNKPKIVILGAGLQGVSVALELAHRGVQVLLIDQDQQPMNRASLRNEGKIHLGLIYANDPSQATGKLQLQGALSFYNLLKRWLGSKIESLGISTPFTYLVAQDSILNTEELEEHYYAIDTEYKKQITQFPELNYLGQKPETLYSQLTLEQIQPYFATDNLQGAFQTAEVAIDTDDLARLLRQAVYETPNIDFLGGKRVKAVERVNDKFRIQGIQGQEFWQIEAEQVVNATWENRMAIDQSVGLVNEPGWLHRLKYRVIVEIPDSLVNFPSATMVIGRYGDIVIRPNQTAYLSWYPVGLQGWTHDLTPPDSWDGPCRGEVPQEKAMDIANKTIGAISKWVPEIANVKLLQVDAGAILAHGKTDVDDASSSLHNRSKIGLISNCGYHSINAGKLTTAPLCALSVADSVVKEIKSLI